MLSQEEIDRIRHEEQVRIQIREELDGSITEAKKTGSKIMDFLNSQVGMWLLSSVVLTGGAALIQQIQHSYQIREQNHQQLVNHAFEIENRLDNMEFLLRHAKSVGDAKKALAGLFKSIYPLSPELQNRSLSSLYFSVYNLIPSDRQKRADEAIEFVRQLEDSEYILQSRADDAPLNETDRAQFEKLIKACKAVQKDISVSRTS